MKKSQLYFLAILTGMLLSLAWPARGFPFLAFIAFVPLLWIEHEISNNKYYFNRLSFFGYSYIAMLIWNAVGCWWILYASWFGATAVIILNSLVMAMVLHVFHITKKILPKKTQGYVAFIILWLTFEYLHQDWELAWPWLNLGYVFSDYPAWIQWYEFTGFLGGSLWVLIINVVLFNILRDVVFAAKRKARVIGVVSVIIIFAVPSVFSLSLYYSYQEEPDFREVVIVQPDIEPYTEKYDKLSPMEQLDIMLELAKKSIDESTDLAVFPETALVGGIWENNMERNRLIKKIREFQSGFTKLKIVIGAITYELYNTKEKPTISARKQESTAAWYDAFNTALLLENDAQIQKYHKSELVPGVEKVPFPQFMSVLGDISVDLGGTNGMLGTQQYRSVFETNDNGMKIAPIICYESIFAEYLTEYVLRGANLLTVITNDGWWRNSPGYRQHASYARLRAIENRRNVVRSANNGISCIIGSKGEIIAETNWREAVVIKSRVSLNNKLTFYSKTGDFIGRIASFFCALLLLYAASTRIMNKSKLKRIN